MTTIKIDLPDETQIERAYRELKNQRTYTKHIAKGALMTDEEDIVASIDKYAHPAYVPGERGYTWFQGYPLTQTEGVAIFKMLRKGYPPHRLSLYIKFCRDTTLPIKYLAPPEDTTNA